MLRAICFDLWDTLIADPPGRGAVRAADRVRRVQRALRAGGWPASPAAITDAIQAALDSLTVIHNQNRDVDAAERVALLYRHLDPTLRPAQDLPAPTQRAVSDAILGGVERVQPNLLPGAPELLVDLRRRGLRLALVSNAGLSPGAVLRRTLRRFAIDRHFAVQLYSDETGAWKPHARMFAQALTALAVTPEETAFVGDTPETDILGAQACGLRWTALVGAASVDGVRPDLHLRGVGELFPALSARGLL